MGKLSKNTSADARSTAEKPSDILRELYSHFKNATSSTRSNSIRAFARKIGMSHSLMSYLLNGHRTLTVKQAMLVAAKLNLSQVDEQRIMNSALKATPTKPGTENQFEMMKKYRQTRGLPKMTKLDITKFKIIHWYHSAIMDLASIDGFNSDPEWIARRLGISTADACAAIDRLVDLGLMKWQKDELHKVDTYLWSNPERSEFSMREYHKQMIQKGLDHLEKTDSESFSSRSITGVTMGVKKTRLEEVMLRIDEFQKEIAEYLTVGQSDELYQLQILLFPLTQPLASTHSDQNNLRKN